MSVEVKTPTKTAFVHREVFPCGEGRTDRRTRAPADTLFSPNDEDNEKNTCPARRASIAGGKLENFRSRKRRHSERSVSVNEAELHNTQSSLQHAKKRYGKGGVKSAPADRKKVLPTKFLLGGNIRDPLNLNSLCDEEVNRMLNESTPHSSPVPLPAHKKEQVELLIPPNINDPLNLNISTTDDAGLTSPKSGLKKKKNKHKKKKSLSDLPANISANSACEEETEEKEDDKTLASEAEPPKDFSRPMHIDITCTTDMLKSSGPISAPETYSKPAKPLDQIVSPVIPQRSPPRARKRRRTYSDGAKVAYCVQKLSSREDVSKTERTPVPKKTEKEASVPLHKQANSSYVRPRPREKKKRHLFVHGNYNRYYGYRNPSMEEDWRLQAFQREWFDGKDVLDIGCNVGHITLSLARDHCPRRIIGMDIDGSLINIAKKNVRHYMSSHITSTTKFASSLPLTYGPIAPPPVPNRDEPPEFPSNVMFMQANYVLEKDDLLDLQREEYDVILALSITKWVHLNNGDAGVKRFFKRIFKQLRPGGKLILEPQGWTSYKKKKKITDEIFKTFQSIQLRPEQFTEYLLSKEVGFSTCQKIDIPYNKSKGFQRPIQVFTKSDTAAATPYGCESRGVTPRIHNTDSSHTPGYTQSSRGATPKFSLGSPSSETSANLTPTWTGSIGPKYSCTPLLYTAATPASDGSPCATPRVEPCDVDSPAHQSTNSADKDDLSTDATSPKE